MMLSLFCKLRAETLFVAVLSGPIDQMKTEPLARNGPVPPPPLSTRPLYAPVVPMAETKGCP